MPATSEAVRALDEAEASRLNWIEGFLARTRYWLWIGHLQGSLIDGEGIEGE